MSKAHFGLIGLGVMGENLVLNAERNGFSSVVFNRTYSKTEEFLQGRGLGKNIEGAETLQEFVNKLETQKNFNDGKSWTCNRCCYRKYFWIP